MRPRVGCLNDPAVAAAVPITCAGQRAQRDSHPVDQSRTPTNDGMVPACICGDDDRWPGPATLLRADASRPSPSCVMAALGDSDG